MEKAGDETLCIGWIGMAGWSEIVPLLNGTDLVERRKRTQRKEKFQKITTSNSEICIKTCNKTNLNSEGLRRKEFHAIASRSGHSHFHYDFWTMSLN